MTAIGNSDHSQQPATFLRGWGGVVAALLGIAVPVALSPLISKLVSLFERAMVASGMTRDVAIMILYWLQYIGIGAGFAIVFLSTGKRMDALRGGMADWSTVLREALVVACAVALWVAANSAWESYGDTFNTYGAATELPAVGLMVLIIAGSAIAWWARRRRSSAGKRPS
jgi:hypothetical protein